ncbi:MAG: hemolysin family protein [Clostridiales bacterium]|nr:hemolysin family protein [Clostridiales bacterium]
MDDADPGGSFAPQIAILIVLIVVTAFFVMAEFAFVATNRARIKSIAEDGDKNAKLLYELMGRPTSYLSAAQVCITLAGFLQSAIAATYIAEAFSAQLAATGLPHAREIGVVVITVILAFFNLLFGEVLPKRLALQYSEKVALFLAKAVRVSEIFTFPFVWLLSRCVSLILRPFGIKEDGIEEIYSEEEIMSILEVGQETGHIDETGKEMIDNIFQFDDKLAFEIMTPRTDVYMQDINDPLTGYVDEMIGTRFSRIPYFDKDNDDIVGVLYMKDFMIEARKTGFTRVKVGKLLQKPFFVPESKNIADLFEEMRKSKTHMAFLVDEYGGFSGIVTLEDLVEEVMGDISDEYDDSEPGMEKVAEDTWLIDGNYYLDDLNEELGLKMESEVYETVGGLIIDRLGEISDDDEPANQVVEIDGCLFTVESWKDRRIESVRLKLPESDAAPAEAGDS